MLVSALTCYALWLLPGIKINQSFSHYFPENDAEIKFYHEMTSELGDEDDYLAVAIVNRDGIFDSIYLNKINHFANQCESLAFVVQASSLTKITEPVKTPFGFVNIPVIHLDDPTRYLSDSIAISNDERFVGTLISKDFRTLVVNIKIQANLTASQSQELINSLESLIQKSKFHEHHIVGRKYFEVSYNRISNKELKKGITLCLLIISLFLGWMYRSLWAVMLPMATFMVSVTCFAGYFVLINRPLDAMSNLLPSIILISCLSDVIHLFSNYEDKLKTTTSKDDAMIEALNEVGLATFMTAVTTVIGFLTFAISPIPAIRHFGLDVSVGVMLTYLLTHLIIPAIMVNIRRDTVIIRQNFNNSWDKVADWLIHAVTFHRKPIVLITLSLLVISIVCIFFINTNNLLMSSFPLNHPIRKSVIFFENNLSGARTLEIAITPEKGKTLKNLQIIVEIDKLHRHLDSLPLPGGIISPVTFYKSLNKSWNRGNQLYYTLPESQETLDKQLVLADKYSRLRLKHIMNEEKTIGKISAHIPDIGRMKVADFNHALDKWIESHIDSDIVTFKITGASHMIDKIQEYSIKNLLNGLLIDAFAIGLLIAIALRNWKMVIITLITNIYPLFMAAALMGITGIELRYGTSIIFIIGLVIAVDDTTHFLSKYMIARLKKIPEKEAVNITLHQTGRPVLITFGILFLGFAILIFSDFRDSQAVGILVSFLLFFGLLADLFLVPLLLTTVNSKKSKEGELEM